MANWIRIALTISSGIVRLWIDSVFTQHGEKLKDKRKLLTREPQPGERERERAERVRINVSECVRVRACV